ncbi:hypothetical protein MRB53_009336 [Persea americana]|uniref:Uncharacterized protein n=1 Tax=Persea americana TaxID=3435 RepID=A0ACC2LPU5_PERAE|nr:hypothetical protein MRB53_009336 [Persea americana]
MISDGPPDIVKDPAEVQGSADRRRTTRSEEEVENWLDLLWVFAEEEDAAGPAWTVSWPSPPAIARTSHRRRGKVGLVSIAIGYAARPRLVRMKKKSSVAAVVRFCLNREKDTEMGIFWFVATKESVCTDLDSTNLGGEERRGFTIQVS